MPCPNCGIEPPEGTQVCPKCGHLLSTPDQVQSFPNQEEAGELQAKTSRNAIASLVLGILGIFCGLTGVPGLILGIIALHSIKDSQGKLKGKYLALAGMTLSISTICLYVAAILILPGFLYHPPPNKSWEARMNLGAIYTAYQSYYADYNTYPSSAHYVLADGSTANCFSIAGFNPLGKSHRYGYVCNETMIYAPEKLWPGPISSAQSNCGGTGMASKTGFTTVACGNIDSDKAADVWMVNDQKVLKNTNLAGASCNDIRISDPTRCGGVSAP